jgi:hypothetical protein
MRAGGLRGLVGTVCAVAANGLVCVKAGARQTYWSEPLQLDRLDADAS